MFYIKALHIIFVVTWFAGLFYIVRLFIYHIEANDKPEPEKSILQQQFSIMEKRLWYGITWPSAILTAIFGPWLMFEFGMQHANYMHLKLGFVLFLYIYHILCHRMFKQLQQNTLNWSSNQLRLWNEVATVFLITIIFIIVLKDLTNWIYGLVGLVLFAVLLMLAIRIYKRIREK